MIDQSLRNMFGLRDTEKRVYHIATDEVSKEEYEYCQVLHNVLWGDKGLADTLGPTWLMIHDSRFENLENRFIVNRPSVFGGDARLGVQHVDGAGLMSHSMVDLEAYAEILGEGRHFAQVAVNKGIHPREFYSQPDEVLWKIIREECPNYFDNLKGEPNKRATRLLSLFRGDLVGLVHDYTEVALFQDWIKLNSGEQATKADFLNAEEEPVVWAEVDMLERALTMRASLRVTAVKVLQRSGLLKLLETKYDLTDQEIDEVLKLVYQTPYEKMHEIPAKVITYANQCMTKNPDTIKRLLSQCAQNSKEAKVVVAALKSGERKPITVTDEEKIERELTDDEKLVLAIQANPYRLELFLLFVEAEKNSDQATIDKVRPILYNLDVEPDEGHVAEVRTATRNARIAASIKDTLI